MTGIIHNGYYKLTKQLFKLSFKRTLVMSTGLLLLTTILMLNSVNQTSFILAYESLMVSVGIRYVFLAAVVFWMISETAAIHFECIKGGGYNIVMMLPTPRRNVFLSYCTRGVVCVLIIWTSQILALLAAYVPVVTLCNNTAITFAQARDLMLPFDVPRTNGLFLAVIRSDLFHILLPQSVPEAISSLLILLGVGCLPAYVLAGGFRRMNMVHGILAGLTAIFLLWSLINRFNSTTMGIDLTAFVISTALLLLFVTIAIIDGVRQLNKEANLA